MIKNFLIHTLFLFVTLGAAVTGVAQGRMIITGTDTTYFDIQPDAEEFLILKEFYEKTGGKKWKKSTNWLKGSTSADFSNWYGVKVVNGDVAEIVLERNKLDGSVPSSLYKLTRLSNVSLSGNSLKETTETKTKTKAEQLKNSKPLYGFIENKGQIRDQNNNPNNEVKYLLPLANNNVLLKANGFSYDTYLTEEKESQQRNTERDLSEGKMNRQKKEVTFKHHRIDVEFIGANVDVQIIAEEPSNEIIYYYTGETEVSVSHFGKIIYKNIYDGIDVEFVAKPGKEKPIEYNFILKPGADISQIKVHYKGVNNSELRNGKLHLKLSHGTLTESIPLSFWKESNAQAKINYRKLSASKNEVTVGFSTDDAIRSKETLVIDPTPVLEWGSYFGGSSFESVQDMVTDAIGNLYLIGATHSSNSIASDGAFQTSYAANTDMFLTRFTPNGTRLWSTYYGGAENDNGWRIDVDQAGNIFIVAIVTSTNLSTAGTYQAVHGGMDDCLLAKFNPNGGREWATYYGGLANDIVEAIALDKSGNIYVTGRTSFQTLPSIMTTPGAHQTVLRGSNDMFIAKFNSSGFRQWGTYFGGNEFPDTSEDICVDKYGNIYIAGYTTSVNYISTPGSHQPTYSGSEDVFITKFDTNGVQQWGTYYGGLDLDRVGGIVCDYAGNVYFAGYTRSNEGIASAGAFKTSLSNTQDAYVVKLNTNGVRQWGTYFGGLGNWDQVEGIDIDEAGNIYLIGETNSSTIIPTPDAYQPSGSDCFIAQFDNSGIQSYGSYYGGSGDEHGYCIATTNNIGEFFVAGTTTSTSDISTAGSAQPSFGGQVDCFIAKFSGLEGSTITPGYGLPYWAMSVKDDKDKVLSFRNSPAVATDITNSPIQTTHRAGSTAIDNCGRIGFYVMFNGSDVANRLHIYAGDGTQLTNETVGSPLLALNSSNVNNEIQIVQVPGKTDEWYIVYDKYLTPCGAASGYCPAQVVYARVRYNSFTKTLTILSREVDLSASDRYIHGKAVSASVDGDFTKKYLYLALRTANVQTTKFHRFIIDANGIGIDANGIRTKQVGAQTIPAQYWSLTIPGSILELSADGTTLAMSNKNEILGYEDLIVFDVARFSDATYVPIIIKVPELMVDLVWNGTPIRKSIAELYTNNTAPNDYKTVYDCFKHMHRKMGPLQFSPSGQYLYLTGGGFVDTGLTARTYLLQIDIRNPDLNGKYSVRIQVQKGLETGACGGDAIGPLYKTISQIQSAYDGRIYFSGGLTKLHVIPQPDCLMPQNLIASDVDLSTPEVPNIVINGPTNFVFLPEQIDGYTYQPEGTPVNGIFTIDKVSAQLSELVTFTLTNYSAANTYQLNWGDGTTQSVSSVSPITHSFSSAGERKITLTTFSPLSCPTVSTQTVLVSDCSSLAGINVTATKYICAIKFNTKKLKNCTASYVWNFGDGTPTSLERNPIHAYSNAGTYNASVTITYDCASCDSTVTLNKEITYNPSASAFEDQVVQIVTDRKNQVVANSVATFSDSWLLQHEATGLDDRSSYLNGSEGVWRNDGSYVYEVNRLQSVPVNLKTDGTYTFENFNWEHADLEAIPSWIKANSMTQYSPYSYELENKDALGVYSTALYDYGGQLPVATGVNMRNKEMAFTSFEELKGLATGNWIFGTQSIPEFTQYVINSGNMNMGVVEVQPAKLQGVLKADVVTKKRTGNLFPDNEIICVTAHPNTTEWSLVVFKTSPSQAHWSGTMKIKNTIIPVVSPDIDATFGHTGKSSLKVTAVKTFKQQLLELEQDKVYVISCWVSVKNLQPLSSTMATGLGLDLVIKSKTGQVVATVPTLVPSGPIIEGWQQVKGVIEPPVSEAFIEISFKPGSTGTAWYDDLRLYPQNGNMKSYVYQLNDYRLRAILDEENFASYFYYDAEGDLYLTKKETAEGIKTLTENVSYQKER
jgi:PKD repeat protein